MSCGQAIHRREDVPPFFTPWLYQNQAWAKLRNQSPQKVSFPYKRLTGQPLIYASLGSVQNTKVNLFRSIAEACQELDAQLVITHGGGMSKDEVKTLPGSPLVVEYAPQIEILAKASLTITHGGMNTVMDSLSFGVPLVAIPITFEQPTKPQNYYEYQPKRFANSRFLSLGHVKGKKFSIVLIHKTS